MSDRKNGGSVITAPHTPGPWAADDLSLHVTTVGDPYGYGPMMIANVRGWGHLTGRGACSLDDDAAIAIQQANARLMAAAPELLAALKEVVIEYGPWHEVGCPCDDTCDCTGKPIHDRINAAIRKAEGRS